MVHGSLNKQQVAVRVLKLVRKFIFDCNFLNSCVEKGSLDHEYKIDVNESDRSRIDGLCTIICAYQEKYTRRNRQHTDEISIANEVELRLFEVSFFRLFCYQKGRFLIV